jgi:hypothetical protein
MDSAKTEVEIAEVDLRKSCDQHERSKTRWLPRSGAPKKRNARTDVDPRILRKDQLEFAIGLSPAAPNWNCVVTPGLAVRST